MYFFKHGQQISIVDLFFLLCVHELFQILTIIF